MISQQINIDQLPKQFSENIIIGSNDQMFMFVVLVGGNATAYAITPEHAKNMVKILSEHVEKFEKDVRPIRDVSASVRSPLQPSELGSNGKEGSSK